MGNQSSWIAHGDHNNRQNVSDNTIHSMALSTNKPLNMACCLMRVVVRQSLDEFMALNPLYGGVWVGGWVGRSVCGCSGGARVATSLK